MPSFEHFAVAVFAGKDWKFNLISQQRTEMSARTIFLFFEEGKKLRFYCFLSILASERILLLYVDKVRVVTSAREMATARGFK